MTEGVFTEMIEAVVLAAGLSTRMGRPKMVLPWGKITVIEKVITTLISAGVQRITVVTGGAEEDVTKAIQPYAVRRVFNPEYRNGEMLGSIRVGLQSLSEEIQAAMFVLGDQPQIEEEVIRQLLGTFYQTDAALIIPSYQMRRGHPWIVRRRLWTEILALPPSATMRDFFKRWDKEIFYVNVMTASILMDIDTPEEYERQKPESP